MQETLLAAWRGLGGFEQRSSLRTWLYRIATNCRLRLAERRPRLLRSWDTGPARSPDDDLGAPVPGRGRLEPLPDDVPGAPELDPAAAYARREAVGLAWIVFGSRTRWHGLLAQGLVDELHLMVGPAALGGGTPTC